MVRVRWPIAIVAMGLALASCASTPAPPVTAGYTRTFDAALRSNAEAQQAWGAYLDSIQSDMDRFYGAKPNGRFAMSFDIELAARKSLLTAYAVRRAQDAASADGYLDELLAIRDAGYLRQYVFYELDPGDWRKPADLEEGGYFSWMRSRYPAHTPRTQAVIRRVTQLGSPAVQVVEMTQWSAVERRMVELSFIALSGFWSIDPAKVTDAVRLLMERMLPRQEIVWGPAVHHPAAEGLGGMIDPYSDALELICRDAGSGEYTVVFRGTNPVSSTEWLLQDFRIQKQVPWREIRPGPAPADAMVSEGTATAINMRLAIRPAEGVPGQGITLAEALVSILERAEGRCVIHFTGHSLGGLMSSTMALWLVDYLANEGRQDLLSKLDLDIYSIAAPTTGNRAFNQYFASRLRGCAYYANLLDVVPHAWAEESLAMLPSLYAPRIVMQPLTTSMYDLCMGMARGQGYLRTAGVIPVPAKVVPVRADLYLLEAIYQHSVPYLDMLLPSRREMILQEVLQPIALFVTVPDVKPADIGSLFSADQSSSPQESMKPGSMPATGPAREPQKAQLPPGPRGEARPQSSMDN